MTKMGETSTVLEYLRVLKHEGFQTEYDPTAGTAVARDTAGNVVFRAIQKGRNQPWIIIFTDSEAIKWTEPPAP